VPNDPARAKSLFLAASDFADPGASQKCCGSGTGSPAANDGDARISQPLLSRCADSGKQDLARISLIGVDGHGFQRLRLL
jgi:hypothetical protein